MNKRFWFLADLLWPLAMAIFLLPLAPSLSTLPVLIWLGVRLLSAPEAQRWVLWPCLALLLLAIRPLLINSYPQPASLLDGLLLVIAFLSAVAIPRHHWRLLLRLPLLAIVPIVFNLGPKPWAPNPIVGANQGAYLLGLLLILALGWFAYSMASWRMCLLPGFLAGLLLLMVWNTGSRAALVGSVVSSSLVWLRERSRAGSFWTNLVKLISLGALVYLSRWLLLSFGSGLPGLKSGSDLGRILVGECFALLPLGGGNRLLLGVGFERVDQFCQIPYQDQFLHHAHNVYLQLWGATGLLGVFGIILILILIFRRWRDVEPLIPSDLRFSGESVLIYVLMMGFFDVSALYWPITLSYTGLLLGMPLAFCPTSAQGADRS